MTRQDAIDLNALAGGPLMEIERYVAARLGLHYPLVDVDSLPPREKILIENCRQWRQESADKILGILRRS